ncbi:CBS domain-containing protein [Robiginitalea sediminis]|uniref:CBS domain-containing protein n=1 Tax=Robiginitalea sediminis TaxID=1982593 RepID=UPI000B4B72BB|nr:CBS domain-containing protein [Robiginitalea sediminis]
MGTMAVKPLDGQEERERYFHRLLTDIAALEQMLEQGLIDRSQMHIGAEQEFCLVTDHWEPSTQAVEVLKDIEDPHFTSELTRYNLEANLDPLPLKGTCFSQMHEQLNRLLNYAQSVAEKHRNNIVLTGILPTIGTRHLSDDYMTPANRYKTLNNAIKKVREADVEVKIKGVDEVNLHHDSIMYEGCNTSFQAHLQIDPDTFADTYNWAQAISGPVLSISTNSPMLMGRELWEETRIALFTQSVDTRRSTFLLNEREPRVGFGTAWASGTAADFFKKSIVRFRSLISTDFEDQNSLEQLQAGETPKLEALNLHNGTVYPWNRLCYGRGNGVPHLRIENRYLPSGPTTSDEIANMMLWVGIMYGRPKAWEDIAGKMDFRDAKKNFFNAARYGMGAQFHWDGKIVPARELLLDFFLPMAYQGLDRAGVDRKDAERYLKVIENRIRSHNGSEWMVQTYRQLRRDLNAPEALRKLTCCLFERAFKGYPVDAWKNTCRGQSPDHLKAPRVSDLMSTRIVTAQEEDSAALVVAIMKWNHFHHLPVLDTRNRLTGLLSWADVSEISEKPEIYHTGIRDLMRSDPITIGRDASAEEARSLMQAHGISSLPVLEGDTLVGILTTNDFT